MWNDHKFFRRLLDNLYDGVYFVDRDRVVTYWNRGAERISGFTPDEVMGHSCMDNILCHVDDQGHLLCVEGCPLSATMEDGRERQAEVYLHHRDGHRVPVLVKAAPIVEEEKTTGAVEIFSDNSIRASDLRRIEELQRLSFLDPLTSLANRRHMDIAISSRLEEMARYGWTFGVIFLDVDHFKHINDSYGHETGDEVLKMVGKTLSNCARVYDMVGRWGGEEFISIVVNADSRTIASTAERYRHMVEQSWLIREKGMLRVTVSLGATQAIPGDTPESLVKRVDNLMYKSKMAGRNRVSCDVVSGLP